MMRFWRNKMSSTPKLILAACLLCGASAAAWTDRLMTKRILGQDNRPPQIIIPNVDDDDKDGMADCLAANTDGTTDEDILQVLVKPAGPLPPAAVVRVEVAEPWTRFARAYMRDSLGFFRIVRGPVELAPEDTAGNGIPIGLEALDFADAGRPPVLGLNIRFETQEGRALHEELLQFAVAPFLVSCCLDPADSIHVVRTNITQRFVEDLSPGVRAAGAGLSIFEDPALPEHDIWIQDAAEIGWATDGERLLRILLHGNRGRELDTLLAKKFLGRDFGVIRKGDYRGKEAEWIDWYGNLEASPPVTVNGREYGNGRVYAGTQGERSMHPGVIAFLEAQGVQSPVLWIDTSWLVIGHVDETVSWVPSKVGTPYRMLIPSPRLAVEILKKTESAAPGGILNRGTKREGDEPGEFERPLADVLNDRALMEAQELVQKKIDAVRRTLQDGLGVAAADIIEIPVLFNSSSKWYSGRYFSETVNMVNGLLVGNDYIVPDPLGPVVSGKDVLLQAVKDRLEPLGCRVWPVDNFYPYHRHGGEIHCGTNATRRPAHLR